MHDLPVSFYLDTRRAISRGQHAGKFPVKIRIDFSTVVGKRRQEYYSTGVYLSRAEYKKALSERPGRALRPVSDKLLEDKARAIRIIRDSPAVNPELFGLLFTGRIIRIANFQVLFGLHIQRFDRENKIKSQDLYQAASNSILDFAEGYRCLKCERWINPLRMDVSCGRKSAPDHELLKEQGQSGLLLNNIDEDFLRRYQAWMIDQGRSLTTVAIYLRNVRAVFNDAIDPRRLISRDLYPFGKGRFVIPETNNLKKAYSDEHLVTLFSFQPRTPRESFAFDFWRLFYYCDGINPIDVAYLTEENLSGEVFSYFRRKTRTTRRVQVEKSVYINEVVVDIFRRRAVHKPYLFGVIKPGMSAQAQRKAVDYWVTRINKGMAVIARKLGLPRPTTYTARHTVGTKYIRAGVDIAKIKDIFSHAYVATTEKYLKGIEGIEEQKELSKLLLVPKKP